MAKFEQRVRLSYFGYSVEFTTSEAISAAIRKEANRIVVAKFGPEPAAPYVERGVPFPEYVPVLRYDPDDKQFL